MIAAVTGNDAAMAAAPSQRRYLKLLMRGGFARNVQVPFRRFQVKTLQHLGAPNFGVRAGGNRLGRPGS